jgi:hypothetical protein
MIMENNGMELVYELKGMINVLRDQMRDDMKEVKQDTKDIKQAIEGRVSQKEFDALKKEVVDIRQRVESGEKAFGIIEAIKNNWQFLTFIFVFCFGMGFGVHYIQKDLHTIATSHVSMDRHTL